MNSGCLFCKIIAGMIPVNRVYEDDICIAFSDINPQAPTHILVVPKEHLASLADAVPEHTPLLGQLMAASAQVASQFNLAKGYRIVVNTGVHGGQTVHHLHLHVLGGRHMGWPPG